MTVLPPSLRRVTMRFKSLSLSGLYDPCVPLDTPDVPTIGVYNGQSWPLNPPTPCHGLEHFRFRGNSRKRAK